MNDFKLNIFFCYLGPSEESMQCTYKFENEELYQYYGQESLIHTEEDQHRFQGIKFIKKE